ncbi:DUF2165 domain-containing protein [Actinokineospora iranica]|uniref:Predicted small integral membrane protein n=1 Tax=Actinokineospora iranica TaxID=1271860 RepID=A0A1G6J2N4_9PSEU|nr:DUF2165 domain-containing protein [Actinokineospora iranica]SDC13058.1 Predicted small integral membrane protein [Actinokineospora iranica]
MRVISRLGGLRTAVTLMTLLTAIYLLLVAVNNTTDYPTNEAFVIHVLAMDTTFGSPNTMWRAITAPWAATAAYIGIIVWEALTALVLATATVQFFRRQDTVARQWATAGWVMMLALFGLGFIVIGGEWFLMWQSQQWNGLQAALQNVIIASVGLVLAHLPRQTR